MLEADELLCRAAMPRSYATILKHCRTLLRCSDAHCAAHYAVSLGSADPVGTLAAAGSRWLTSITGDEEAATRYAGAGESATAHPVNGRSGGGGWSLCPGEGGDVQLVHVVYESCSQPPHTPGVSPTRYRAARDNANHVSKWKGTGVRTCGGTADPTRHRAARPPCRD